MNDLQPANTESRQGAIYGLAAAALFGLSTPLAKLLLGEVSPVLLAGLLYMGAALGLTAHRGLASPSREAPLDRAELGTLAGLTVCGGVIGPVLMLLGLSRVSALTGSLLLNLEAPLTMLLAVLAFGEHIGRQAGVGASLIVAGAVLLALSEGTLEGQPLGVLLLAGACAAWAIDNNLTQRLSGKDPFAIVRAKTWVAGISNTTLGLLLAHDALPSAAAVLGAMLLGSVSYGMSVVLDARALRLVGAAREAAYFATAPFVGALFAIAWLGDPPHTRALLAMAMMVLGVTALLRERHSHTHVHEPLSHDHLHVHDIHHRHAHEHGESSAEPHSHPHHHEPITHAHAHVPDVHHRHRH